MWIFISRNIVQLWIGQEWKMMSKKYHQNTKHIETVKNEKIYMDKYYPALNWWGWWCWCFSCDTYSEEEWILFREFQHQGCCWNFYKLYGCVFFYEFWWWYIQIPEHHYCFDDETLAPFAEQKTRMKIDIQLKFKTFDNEKVWT